MTARATIALLSLTAITIAGSACAARAPQMGAEVAPPTLTLTDDIADLERQLAERENALRSSGVAVPADGAVAGADGDAPVAAGAGGRDVTQVEAGPDLAGQSSAGERETLPQRCVQICDIRDSICSLETHICSLARSHEGEPRYQNACARAHADCELATGACDACP